VDTVKLWKSHAGAEHQAFDVLSLSFSQQTALLSALRSLCGSSTLVFRLRWDVSEVAVGCLERMRERRVDCRSSFPGVVLPGVARLSSHVGCGFSLLTDNTRRVVG
jgi:hypothetical protein